MVREFCLINNLGQTYSLMDSEEFAFFHKPKGLGFDYNSKYLKVGNVFSPSIRELSQSVIDGELYFHYYENYRKLISFIHKATKLTLKYVVPYKNSIKTYYKDVTIDNLTKGDKEENGYLISSISLNSLSLWYEHSNFIIEDDDNVCYWDFYFDSYFAQYSSRDLEYINNGDLDGSIDLIIYGEVTNPKISLYIEGELFQEIEIKTQLMENERLYYSSKSDDFYIKKRNSDGTYTDLFDLNIITFENDNVLRIPPGKQCRITLTAVDSISKADLNIYSYYVSM